MKGMLSGYCVCKLLYMRHKLQTCASGNTICYNKGCTSNSGE